jgi:hypothetical protein
MAIERVLQERVRVNTPSSEGDAAQCGARTSELWNLSITSEVAAGLWPTRQIVRDAKRLAKPSPN